MPDSLLSRFDLIFIIKDEKKEDADRKISERVVRNHRMADPAHEIFNQFHEEDNYMIEPLQRERESTGVYEKSGVFETGSKSDILSQSFLKKYINKCKK